MASFRDTRDALLIAYDQQLMNDEEFILLYNINTSKNFDYPYWNYELFKLDNWSDDECRSDLRFYKADVYRLFEVLRIPETLTTYNRSRFDGMEAFCIFLKRFSYPCRFSDLFSRFGRPVPELCMMSNAILEHIHENFNHLLHDFDQPWHSPALLQEYSEKVHEKGAPLANCFGFVDGTVRPICKPGVNQRILYNGHKRVHSIKFQSVVIPSGLISNLHGPYEGKRHDSSMLGHSGLLDQLQQYAHSPNCLYGDPAYPLRVHLQAPLRGNLNQLQEEFNSKMSKVRISVEWLFKEISTYFAFLDFKKNLKIGLSPVGKMYRACALLTNARTCLYKSQTSEFFNIDPLSLEEYFI